jgi:hypothetical protein
MVRAHFISQHSPAGAEEDPEKNQVGVSNLWVKNQNRNLPKYE